nr:MAG: ORF1 [Torque teno midi virus]UHM27129.1 MAG: ORF1 [Torque teno midi virus]
MPFWWGRRNRFWNNNRYRRRRRRKTYRKPRKRFLRYRHRRTTRRRRRRRRTKVRRKKRFLKLVQWQPDCIRKCKIKGIETAVLGANGKQYRNYVTAMNEWTLPTTPTGGGFATIKYSLGYLFEQYELHNNIWTSSNIGLDLCRYTGCKIIFFRHPTIDFIATYQREYPMIITADTYSQTHPKNMLLQKHKIVIPSFRTQPYKKRKIVKKIGPPKQQVNKWFFQEQFDDTGLLFLRVAAADLNYVHLGEESENELTTFLYLNTADIYQQGNWGKTTDTAYQPIATYSEQSFTYTDINNKTQTFTKPTDYNSSISYDKGWFNSSFLSNKSILTGQFKGKRTILAARYNPKTDTGEGNAIWLSSIHTDKYTKPDTDKVLIASGKPLWELCYGWTDYVKRLKKNESIEYYYYILLQSPCIQGAGASTKDTYYLPIDSSFINGKGPYNSTPTQHMTKYWYPSLIHQQQTINNIVKTGPFIPRPEGKKSNWELHLQYCFYFKWGGSLPGNKQVTDPSKQTMYPVPDTNQQAVQIADPKTQIPASLLHSWDFRRGFVTTTAFKRMSDHFSMESTLSTDSEFLRPHKKSKHSKKEPPLQEEETDTAICLQQLCEEGTCQEIQEEKETPVLRLIQQQQQQQQHIKYNLLQLLTSLRKAQMQMQLQTGNLE